MMRSWLVIFVGRGFRISWRKAWFVIAKWIDEVGNKIFFGGASFEDFFFVFDDNLVIGDFDDLAAMDGKLRIDKTFDERTLDDNLLDDKVVGVGGVVDHVAEFWTFFGFFDFDDVVLSDELVGAIDDDAVGGIFADGGGIEDGAGAVHFEADDFEIVGVDDGGSSGGDGGAGLDAEDGDADEFAWRD